VIQEAYPEMKVEVYETGGSGDSVRLLEEGRVDLGTIQADTEVSDRVQGVAILFADAFQLIVDEDSSLAAFSDLAGRRVAIPPINSGQNPSFWFLVDHFGLGPNDMTALPMSEAAANFAMIHGQVDAIFRVRTPGNPAIRTLMSRHPMRVVPISQSDALSLKKPSITTGVIPVGSYRGYPPLPPADLPTALVDRLLVARVDLDKTLVHRLTRVLFEWRTHLVTESKLAGFIEPLLSEGQRSFPIHAGAQRYYDREKPGFVQQNMRTVTGVLYLVVILTSFTLALRGRYKRARRVRMGDYNLALMGIADQAQEGPSAETLQGLKEKLLGMLRQVVEDLNAEHVTQEEFEHFSFTWQAVDRLVRDNMAMQPANSPLPPAEKPGAGVGKHS